MINCNMLQKCSLYVYVKCDDCLGFFKEKTTMIKFEDTFLVLLAYMCTRIITMPVQTT